MACRFEVLAEFFARGGTTGDLKYDFSKGFFDGPPAVANAAATEMGLAEAAGEQAAPEPSKPAIVPGPGLSRPSTPAFEFLVNELRSKPTCNYGELKAKADERGLKIAPIMYGRAKALLGLVPVRPRGQGKNRKKPDVSELSRAEACAQKAIASAAALKAPQPCKSAQHL